MVLMDIQMPGGDGLDATQTILATCPNTRVLILTTFDLDEYVYRALRAGASGFLLKTASPAELVRAVPQCAAGDRLLAPSVTDRLIERFIQHPPPGGAVGQRLAGLTPRELDVLRAVARRLSNAEVGASLYLSEATVKTHMTRILAKLGLRDRLQAVVVAYETGLADPASPDGRPPTDTRTR
ncbi:MAG: response regulator transcription factor [Micropruina sp.]|uniref:LuxR C-terminal-related transcriptional regulator n=1 Tax=Micropruina sp. TaxID=2737536 RepID=UPI0039E27496